MTKYSCSACREVCPTGAIDLSHGFQIDQQKCTGCGACVNVCPVEAVRLADVSYLHWFSAALKRAQGQKELRIVCERAEAGSGDLVVPCLGWINECLLVGLGALSPVRVVELVIAPCAACAEKKNLRTAKRRIRCARQFLKSARKSLRITLSDATEIPMLPRVRRRFRKLKRRLKGRLRVLSTASNPQWRLEKREILAQALGQLKPRRPLSLSWYDYGNIKLRTELCTGCGYCEKVCPTGALKLESGEQEAVLTFDVYRCIKCGLCASWCPEEALRVQRGNTGHFQQQQPRVLTRFRTGACSYCGREVTVPVGAEMICPTCARNRDLAEGYLI